ncbi:hypothetical protein LXL04_024000 [Taraxacum kok-saghyz]
MAKLNGRVEELTKEVAKLMQRWWMHACFVDRHQKPDGRDYGHILQLNKVSDEQIFFFSPNFISNVPADDASCGLGYNENRNYCVAILRNN